MSQEIVSKLIRIRNELQMALLSIRNTAEDLNDLIGILDKRGIIPPSRPMIPPQPPEQKQEPPKEGGE